MKRKNPQVLALILQSSVVLSTFLFSLSLASAQTAAPTSPTINTLERQELRRLREERRIQQQVQAEANLAFSRKIGRAHV